MSVLLVGRVPIANEGKRYVLGCRDRWREMLSVLDSLLRHTFPFDLYFFRDHPTAPRTPHLDQSLAYELSRQVAEKVINGEAEDCLRERYRDDDAVPADPHLIDGWVESRLAQLMNLVGFLATSGGCCAQW